MNGPTQKTFQGPAIARVIFERQPPVVAQPLQTTGLAGGDPRRLPGIATGVRVPPKPAVTGVGLAGNTDPRKLPGIATGSLQEEAGELVRKFQEKRDPLFNFFPKTFTDQTVSQGYNNKKQRESGWASNPTGVSLGGMAYPQSNYRGLL